MPRSSVSIAGQGPTRPLQRVIASRQLPGRLACFTPREAVRDRVHHRPERLRPPLLDYRGPHGHRVLLRRH